MLAHRLSVPYPIVLVLGGLLISFVPGLPDAQLAPDLVFLLFLPPLLYISAFYTSVRDFRAHGARSCRSRSAWADTWPRRSYSAR
jgi:CPA1 family monovalent cation:H+ antiporter